jgi:hypothetical protein
MLRGRSQAEGEEHVRYEVYDDDGKLFRKFWDKESAQKFMQQGWKLVTKAKQKEVKPTPDTHGEARW